MKALHNNISPDTKSLIISLYSKCGICLREIGEVLNIEKSHLDSFYQRILKGKVKKITFPKESGKGSYFFVKRRRKRLKLLGVILLGGECGECGYNEDISALQFHHVNPDDKDFALSSKNNSSWSAWKKELKKCDLLCSNCHASKHSTENEMYNDILKIYKN